MAPPPTLPERILLLALHDEKGTTSGSSSYSYALGGAIISELLLEKRISLVRPKKSLLVEVTDATPTGDSVLDAALEKMRVSGRRRGVSSWVSNLAMTRGLKHQVAEGLCARGILRREEGKVLLVFNRTTYPTLDRTVEQEMIDQLRATVVDGTAPDARMLVLISLAHSTGLLELALGKAVVKERKAWIKELVHGDAVGSATREAIEAAQVAMMVSTMVATTVAVSSSS